VSVVVIVKAFERKPARSGGETRLSHSFRDIASVGLLQMNETDAMIGLVRVVIGPNC
jgi:hypothetical protein